MRQVRLTPRSEDSLAPYAQRCAETVKVVNDQFFLEGIQSMNLLTRHNHTDTETQTRTQKQAHTRSQTHIYIQIPMRIRTPLTRTTHSKMFASFKVSPALVRDAEGGCWHGDPATARPFSQRRQSA